MTQDPFQVPGFDSLRFGSLYCIGRNYAKHAAEMNSEVPDEPVVFLKPRSSIIFDGGTIRIPPSSTNVHHEVELAILIGSRAENISEQEAADHIAAYGVSIDVTARDIQSNAKKKGLPWSLAKGFRTFAPIGNLLPFHKNDNLQDLTVTVSVNGAIRQKGHTADMIFSVNRIISYLSEHFTLWPGDLILTGTPEGVSQLHAGDTVRASIDNDRSLLQLHVSE